MRRHRYTRHKPLWVPSKPPPPTEEQMATERGRWEYEVRMRQWEVAGRPGEVRRPRERDPAAEAERLERVWAQARRDD